MVRSSTMRLSAFLFYISIGIALASTTKGHVRHQSENFKNSPQQTEDQTAPEQGQHVPERGQHPERGQPVPERGQPVPERGQPVPERGQPVPERGQPIPERGQPIPERGQPIPERGQPVPERGEPVPEGGRPDEPAPGQADGVEGKCLCDCGMMSGRPDKSYKMERELGYYKYHNKAMNWFAAKRQCEKEGAHLAIINSPLERDLLQNLYKSVKTTVKNPAIFVGLHDLIEEGNWVTIFDVPVNKTGFHDWNVNEPLGATQQNCGALQIEFGKLHDHECHNLLGFICERELNYRPHCV